MAAGSLHPDNLTNGRDREVSRGHGTRALGPSDTSDSGSDVAGGAADMNLDSDSDSTGTGEAATAPGEQLAVDGADIDTDHVEAIPPEKRGDEGEDEDEQARH